MTRLRKESQGQESEKPSGAENQQGSRRSWRPLDPSETTRRTPRDERSAIGVIPSRSSERRDPKCPPRHSPDRSVRTSMARDPAGSPRCPQAPKLDLPRRSRAELLGPRDHGAIPVHQLRTRCRYPRGSRLRTGLLRCRWWNAEVTDGKAVFPVLPEGQGELGASDDDPQERGYRLRPDTQSERGTRPWLLEILCRSRIS